MSGDRASPAPVLEPTHATATGVLKAGTEVLGGRFRVIELLGKGGMGEVYLAEQVSLGRKVALKTLRDDLSLQPGMTERFKREALLLSSVDHPSVVRVIDFGEAEASYVLVMEFVEGDHLGAVVRDGPLSVERAVPMLRDIADGLAAIHAKGIVHRDLKLENVLLANEASGQRARLLDFGIARLAEPDAPGQVMTQAGFVLGTPEYLAPEQATGGKVDARSDVYAFGILAYRLLGGRHPFAGPTARDFLLQHISHEPPALGLSGHPVLEQLVMACLQKDPAKRPDGGRGLSEALLLLQAPQTQAPTAPQRVAARQVGRQRSFTGRNLTLMQVTLSQFAARQSPELIAAREAAVFGAMRAHGGKVVRHWQDLVVAVFELPSRAVACGMAIQDALWRGKVLEGSVAVHQGEVAVQGESLLGEPAQVLAAVAQAAGTGEVVFSHAVFLAMNREGLREEARGAVAVAGREPMVLHRCVPTGPGAPFGGRDVVEPRGLLGRLFS